MKGDTNMATVMCEMNGCISLGSIANEQDLLPREGIVSINPPPKDGRCYCCGRHISELEPFGEAGDPLIGDFESEYLVKTLRPAGPCDQEAEQALREAERRFLEEGFEGPLEWLIDVYGEEKGKSLMYSAEAFGTSCADWLCRDCIALDQDEYFDRLRQSRKQEVEDFRRN
jgi:hypothetical protein